MFEGKLACSACGAGGGIEPLSTVCGACGKPLLVRHPLEEMDGSRLPGAWTGRRGGMWRFRELLPLGRDEDPVTLGEGGTPLLRLPRLGSELDLDLRVKDESRNPTGSFKDRGLSAAVTRATLDGADRLVIPSAGNAGAALSAYAARAGRPARVYVPRDTPEGVARRCRHYGADLREVDGLITDCGDEAREYAAKTGAFDVSTLHEPYRLEGKKTMMLEIAEALEWRPPDAIVYPTGGGTGLIASWKVLGELEALGVVEARTRLYAVQSAGCAPIVRAFEAGASSAEPWEDARTRAFGLRVPGALGDFLILRALRETGGGAVAVTDEKMLQASRDLGEREGVDAAIEGGATLAAVRSLRERGDLARGETVVLFNTGGLLTY